MQDLIQGPTGLTCKVETKENSEGKITIRKPKNGMRLRLFVFWRYDPPSLLSNGYQGLFPWG